MEQKGNERKFDTFADNGVSDTLIKRCADFADKAIPYDQLKMRIANENTLRQKKQISLIRYCCAAATFVVLLGAGVLALSGMPSKLSGLAPDELSKQSNEQAPRSDSPIITQQNSGFPTKDGFNPEFSASNTPDSNIKDDRNFCIDEGVSVSKYDYTSLDEFLTEATADDSMLLKGGDCYIPSIVNAAYKPVGIICDDSRIAFFYANESQAASKKPAVSNGMLCMIWEKYHDTHWFDPDSAVLLDKVASIYATRSDSPYKPLSEHRFLVRIGTNEDIFTGCFPSGMTESECVELMEFELVKLNRESR